MHRTNGLTDYQNGLSKLRNYRTKDCFTLTLVLAASTRDLHSLHVLAASDLFTLARVASSKKRKLVVKDQVFET